MNETKKIPTSRSGSGQPDFDEYSSGCEYFFSMRFLHERVNSRRFVNSMMFVFVKFVSYNINSVVIIRAGSQSQTAK